MNTTESNKLNFFTNLMRDEGIQSALSRVAVAAVVAVAKEATMSRSRPEPTPNEPNARVLPRAGLGPEPALAPAGRGPSAANGNDPAEVAPAIRGGQLLSSRARRRYEPKMEAIAQASHRAGHEDERRCPAGDDDPPEFAEELDVFDPDARTSPARLCMVSSQTT